MSIGTRNLVMLKTQIDSINISFLNGFVYENFIWALASVWIFLCNYVVHSIGFIFTYIFRNQRKNDQIVPLDLIEQNKRHPFEDYEIDKFTEEAVNFIFPSYEDFYKVNEDIEETEDSVLERKIDFDIQHDDEKGKGETDFYVLKEKESNFNEDETKTEGETKGLVFTNTAFGDFHEDVVNIDENEIECSVFKKGNSDFRQHIENVQEEEKETKGSIAIDTIGEMEDEPMFLSFSFLRNVSYDNAFSKIEIIDKKEQLDHIEECDVSHEENEKNFDQENRKFTSNTNGEVSHGFVECENEKEDSSYNEEEMDDDECEWENDEVMEQMKLELRIARQGGLGTIFEEEEEDDDKREFSSNVFEEKIKPLSIEDKMEYKDHIVEIQKVYRCYAQKIKKLDVLNYQAMHAIGLLPLKDPPKLFLMQKSTLQQTKPLVIPQNNWPCKAQKNTIDPMLKLVNELNKDLELVYVAQICLSWEILCWQHDKIQELKKYDSQRPRRYNVVAGEFQNFQVLIQRFLEDEQFQQELRVQSYVKSRCVIRNLLQVPTIKDDSTKDKKKFKWGEEDAIGSERLEQIIKESMQVFWEFLRVGKDEGNVFQKVYHKGNEVKDKENSDILRDIQTQLYKKERKLKEKLRSGNCLVRKFQKHHEDKIQLNHEQLLAQVGLRLISKVLNMKKLRKDHLIWCSEKLNQINFVDKKIQVESSFLLFPC